MHKPEIGPRLRAVADLVPHGAILADVGTDHAYLPVWLIQTGKISSAIVSDLREGPLSRAKLTAEQYDCKEKMEFRLCDGLLGFHRDEVNTVVIAGMGGETIANILSQASWLKNNAVHLILQPMSTQPELRHWLWTNGFAIIKEVLNPNGKNFYTILSAQYGNSVPFTPAEEWAGRQYPGMEAPYRAEYLRLLIQKADRALQGMAQSQSKKAAQHKADLEDIYYGLLRMQEEWEHGNSH